MPSGLPRTRPTTTPIVTGDVAASAMPSALSSMPALAQANSGQRHRFFPERGHVVAGGGVGHDQRGDGCGEQHHAAGGLDA